MDIFRCLIVDTETTGVDPEKDKIIEVGAVLYSVTHATTIAQVSLLVPTADGKNPAQSINEISEDILVDTMSDIGLRNVADEYIQSMADAADVFIAQKASFDKAFLSKVNDRWTDKPWLCTKEDFAFKKGRPGDSLINLALAHGIGVSSAHRALTDCQLIARIFDSYGPEELAKLFEHAALPRETYLAVTSYAEREKAKAAGFGWDSDKKWWHKRLTVSEAAAITDFKIRRLPSATT